MTEFDDTATFSLNDSHVIWDALAKRIEAVSNAWEEAGQPPTLANYVPLQPAAVRRITLVELIKVDMEFRWSQRISPKLVEDYLAEFPELADEGGVPVDLLYEEFHIRQRCGDDVSARYYFERFPQRKDDLARLLGIDHQQLATTLVPTQPKTEIGVGESIDDFDLLTRLGKGAFASVFLARQRSMQRLVALKISADRGVEPQTLAQLDHPHIVRVYDQRTLPDLGTRLLYMQYVRGGTLQGAIRLAEKVKQDARDGTTLLAAVDRALDQRGDSPPIDSSLRDRLAAASWPETVCWVGMQLADALQYAHQREVLHRDLKPANILLTEEGAPKLVDFNISSCSKVAGASPAAYFGGSLAYMSPEQLDAANPNRDDTPESLTPASDIYSLGMVLWELLTLERPFDEGNLRADWGNVLDQLSARRKSGVPQEAIARLPDDCSAALKEILLTCLAADPEERFSSIGELADELRLCLNPAARAVLRAPNRGWRRWARQFSLIAFLWTTFLPNVVASCFNIFYNERQIIEKLGEATANVFELLLFVINLILFPLGLAIAVYLFWPVRRALKLQQSVSAAESKELPLARKRCLQLGHFAAIIGIVGWGIGGIAFPLMMVSLGADLGINDFAHFLMSHATCGLIAASYPFFGLAVLAVRSWLPLLFRPQSATADDCALLDWLGHITWVYLGIAALVPMFAMVLLLALSGSPDRTPLVVLSSTAVGLLGIFFLARFLQRDIRAIADLIRKSK
ncbi:MAG: serine/threonine-protein kinase [Planctomycetota bacterium]|nr:serine/threonine-protein kinase [Planctomycetota bacterium]